MFHAKHGWAQCGHETVYLTKDNESFEPEMCRACLEKYFEERRRKFPNGYKEPELPESERMVTADCGHLGEIIFLEGVPIHPTECLDCFAARHEPPDSIPPEMLDALRILANLIQGDLDSNDFL